MKRKVGVVLVCVGLAVLLFMTVFRWRNEKPFDDIVIANLDKVIIYYPGDRQTEVTESEYIEKIVELLQSMDLNSTYPSVKEGFVFQIDLHYQNNERSDITITGEMVVVDGKHYRCDRDYCDDFRKLCEELWEAL